MESTSVHLTAAAFAGIYLFIHDIMRHAKLLTRNRNFDMYKPYLGCQDSPPTRRDSSDGAYFIASYWLR